MLTTGLLLWAQVHRIGILASWPGPAKGQPLVGSNLMSQATTRKGGRSMRASEILFVGSGFRLFFYLLGAKAAFHRATATPMGRAVRHHACILGGADLVTL